MMNRKLAHGWHLEWWLRGRKQCNPQEACDDESVQRKQRPELGRPIGQWLPTSNESKVSTVRPTIDGIWLDNHGGSGLTQCGDHVDTKQCLRQDRRLHPLR